MKIAKMSVKHEAGGVKSVVTAGNAEVVVWWIVSGKPLEKAVILILNMRTCGNLLRGYAGVSWFVRQPRSCDFKLVKRIHA